MNIFNNIRRKNALAKAKAENKEFSEKFKDDSKGNFAPLLFTGANTNRRVVREVIGTMTGKVVGYIDENGIELSAGMDHAVTFRDPATGKTVIREILSPATEEFRALQEFKAPVKLPENVIVTSQGIIEMSWEDYVKGSTK